MPARRLRIAPRAVIAAALLAALAPGCSGAPPVPAAPVSQLCAPGALDACERKLAAGPPSRALVAAYAEARAAAHPSDPWAALFHALDAADRGPRPEAVILVQVLPDSSAWHATLEGNMTLHVTAPGVPPTRGVRGVLTGGLPPPGAIDADDLILAMATATGYAHVVRLGQKQVTEVFPGDPLAPFVGGLRPVMQVSEASWTPVSELDAEEALRAAFAAAAAFRYVEAAGAAERLSALIEGGHVTAQMALRGRYALQLLGAAGLVLDEEEGAARQDAQEATPAPLPGGTPYEAYLRVVTARDPRKEWEARSAEVLPGVPEARREDFAATFAQAQGCGQRRTPPMESPRDLMFASRLAGALPRDLAAAPAAGQLSLEAWLLRYRAMVGFVEETRTAWYYLPSLLQQRGEAPGLSASGTPLYRRVTDLGLAHIEATRALLQAYPVRYRAFTQVGLAASPGAIEDDRIRQALLRLIEGSVQARLAAAKDAEALLGGIFTGAIAGISYPPALQEAHFLALAGAATARLKGDFLEKTGWGVALLYALDAVYRLASGQAPNLDFSSAQIARALGGAPGEAGVEHPIVAALATAAARYAALGFGHDLDPAAAPDRFPPERRAAREGLRAAIAGLGAPGEAPAPPSVLEDVTTLADGLVATLSAAIRAGARRAPARAGTCAAKRSAVPLDPTTRRALARLGDVRRRILLHPRYRQGDGAWVRRARLLVTVLSDAMDAALAGDAGKAPVFTVPAAEADAVVLAGLRELDQKALTEVIAGSYGLAREVAAAGGPEGFFKKGSRDLRRVAAGLHALFQGEAFGGKGPAMGVAFLEALASQRLDAASSDDLLATLAASATALYDRKEDAQADVCLLSCLVLSGLWHTAPPAAAAALAARRDNRVAWLMRFSKEAHKAGPGEVPDPSTYAEDMRRATDDACQTPDGEATLAVMQAVHDWLTGRRREARAALDGVLEKAEQKGLGVPRMVYRYEEKTATKVFMLDVELSLGNGVLAAGNTFQLGLGVRSAGAPESRLSATLAPLDTAASGEDTARYYVYTAALATVYHLVEGDTDRAVAAGRRAVAALTNGLELGARAIRSERPAAWGDDARVPLAVAAQLAAEAGLPFLAGDLWTVVRQGLSDTLDEKGVAALLDRRALGLGGAEIKPALDRARRSLAILGARLPCDHAKVELGGFEEVGCAGYPLALSLRIADVLEKLPRLRRGPDPSPRCGPLHSLDAFLAATDKGAYDPDAFTRAEEDLRADGKIDDAALLLTRIRHPGQCNPTLVAAARALGRSAIFTPALRADLLGVAFNCTAMTGGPDVEADVVAIDAETRRLPDPGRNVRAILSVAELATRTDQWGLLSRLVSAPDFPGRWLRVHPDAAAAALLLDHAVAAIGGKAVALDRTRATYELLCETFKAPERADLCATIAALRAPLRGPMEERQRIAREAVRKLVAGAAAPRP